jgi:hypothetical protein
MDTDRSGSALSIRYGWDSIARKIAGEYEDVSRVPVNAVKAATQIVY